MSGWEKVIAATVLALVGLVGLNLAIWRRMRAARLPAEIEHHGQCNVEPGEVG